MLNELTKRESSLMQNADGFLFRDLNKNGQLDIYEDPRQPLDARVEDLLSQMTLAEKAGMMFMPGAVVNDDGSIEEKPEAAGFGFVASSGMTSQKLTHFNIWQIPGAQVLATWHNNLQKFAEQSRLGIPLSIASDPRNHFTRNIFSMAATDFSQWCETLGFGALNDPDLVHEFANMVREEYVAVGIRIALHPQIDLATEPRWARISGTFGEDAHVSAALGAAYIAGFQGDELGAESVACMTKHF
ncbi:MAG: glycoside hydrolase family 3 protein, partial [Anaerolineales bacterium]|nr:glycoside hydrolase family 3 protein [Anaerolineales bacterium]